VADGYDGTPYTYSAQALASAGISPGSTLTVNGVSYTWPSAASGQADSIEPDGQKIPVSFPAGSTTIGLLGSAINTTASGTTVTLTVAYTDGSTQQIPLSFSDLTLGQGSYQKLPSDTTVATMPHLNALSLSVPIPAYLFATSASLESGKTVASVTLSNPSGGGMSIFAIGAG